MNRFERVFTLHRLLDGRRVGLSFGELQDRLDWKRTTLRRTIDYLRDVLQAPIVNDPERGGYLYQGENCYQLPGLWFSAQELATLLLIEETLECQPLGLLSETLQPFRARIEALAERAGIGVPNWRVRLRLLRMAARPAGHQFGAVAEALARRRRLLIDYHARSDDRMAPRSVSPQRLTLYRDNWYLDAWCHVRNALRIFAVDRIIAAELIDEPAEEVGEETLNQVLATSYGIFAGLPTASALLRFSPHIARWVADENWHPQQHDERHEDGSLTRSLPYHRTEELLMDILRHGPDVEVLAPATLRQAVVERLRAALSHYESDAGLRRTASSGVL